MSPRRSSCGISDARTRLKSAIAYLEAAQLVLSDEEQFSDVASGMAVLAGIAASDAICCVKLKQRHTGEDHHGAADLLETATPDGKSLATTLTRLLDMKDAAHYGVLMIAPSKARDAVKWAERLASRAREEIER